MNDESVTQGEASLVRYKKGKLKNLVLCVVAERPLKEQVLPLLWVLFLLYDLYH